MITVFRGAGSYKKRFLAELLSAFGRNAFLVRDAALLPAFTPSVFRKLVDAGVVVPVSTTAPRHWRVISCLASAAGAPPREAIGDEQAAKRNG